MKNILLSPLLLSLLITFNLFGNMANPIIDGSHSGTPFTHKAINILHEDLLIKPDVDFKTAYIEAVYHVDVLEDGIKIPFIFYGSKIKGDFTITFDGKPIKLQPVPKNFKLSKQYRMPLDSFPNLKKPKNSIYFIPLSSNQQRGISNQDLRYFELDLSIGKHQIKAHYQANHWKNWMARLKTYWFIYVLSPVKQWRSFGTLNITFDRSELKKQCIITTNLEVKPTIDNNNLTQWHFKKLPADVLTITCTPKISGNIQMVINLWESHIAILITAPFILIFLVIIILKKSAHRKKRFIIISLISWIVFSAMMILISGELKSIVDTALGVDGGPGYPKFYSSRFYHLPLIIIGYPFVMGIIYLFTRKKRDLDSK